MDRSAASPGTPPSNADSLAMAPIRLEANMPADRPYRGGLGIRRFRGLPEGSDWTPEDFVGSTTEVSGGGGVGLTVLPDGRTLRDAIEADPVGFLGATHVAAHGADTRLLVKLLDTRERLFVHFHPSTPFANERLGTATGKTEAWLITSVDGAADAHLGFSRDVGADEIARWFEQQDVAAMLAAMNRVALHAGDTLFVPATLPHAIDPGVTLVELQQPVDLSLLLEYSGVPGLDSASALLGLPRETALAELDRTAWSAQRLADLGVSRPAGEVTRAFPADADPYFRAETCRIRGEQWFAADFAILVVIAGTGELRWQGSGLHVAAGDTLLVPHGAGTTTISGVLTVIRCRPPEA